MGITNPGEPFFKDGGWHWTGSVWIKGGLAFEYAGQLLEQERNTNAPAGNLSLSQDAVPAGEIWVVTSIFAYDMDSAVTDINLMLTQGASDYRFAVSGELAAGRGFVWAGQICAVEGDVFKARFYGLTALDDIQMNVFGYRMRLT